MSFKAALLAAAALTGPTLVNLALTNPALAQAVDPQELYNAVMASLLARADEVAPPALTWGQRVVLEALRGYDDEVLVAAAPRVSAAAGSPRSRRRACFPSRPGG